MKSLYFARLAHIANQMEILSFQCVGTLKMIRVFGPNATKKPSGQVRRKLIPAKKKPLFQGFFYMFLSGLRLLTERGFNMADVNKIYQPRYIGEVNLALRVPGSIAVLFAWQSCH